MSDRTLGAKAFSFAAPRRLSADQVRAKLAGGYDPRNSLDTIVRAPKVTRTVDTTDAQRILKLLLGTTLEIAA